MKPITLLPLALVFICLVSLASENCPANENSRYLDAVREFENNTATYYVAIDGNDANPGKLKQPFKTLEKAIDVVKPGDTIYVRGGKYACAKTIVFDKSGQEGKPIRVWAYETEKPVLDFSKAWGEGFLIKGAYWHLKGLTVTNAESSGICLKSNLAHHNTIECMTAYGNDDSGITLQSGAAHNIVLNCDSHHNFDPPTNGQDADGFGVKFGVSAGNILKGCRAWNNSDDGFDFWYAGSGVHVENCYAYRNGRNIWAHPLWEGNANGFKLGGGEGTHVLSGCVAWDHPARGFDLNNNSTGVTLYNCTAFKNSVNFAFRRSKINIEKNVLRNNLSYQGKLRIYPLVDDQYNSWNEPVAIEITQDDFVSLNDSAITGPRNPDGSVPESNFLRLSPASAAIDTGTDVGLLFLGKSPDLGAFEYDPLTYDVPTRHISGPPDQLATKSDADKTEGDISRDPASKGKDKRGWTPIEIALYYAVSKGRKAVVEQLIAKGADIHANDSQGRTPLHSAAEGGYVDVAKMLITNGADINVTDNYGVGPLHVASREGHKEVAELLIEKGATLDLIDRADRTPVYYAAYNGHANVVALLVAKGTNPKIPDKWGWTPVHIAAWARREEVVQLLLKGGADVYAKNNRGRTPLSLAELGYQIDAEAVRLEVLDKAKAVLDLLRKHKAKE